MQKNEHSEQQNTYQTGFTDRPQSSSGLIAALLVIAIFLGGLASALGILNIRLWNRLADSGNTIPVNSAPSLLEPTGTLPVTNNIPAPQLPPRISFRIQLKDHPEESASFSAEDIFRQVEASVVQVSGEHHEEANLGTGLVLRSDGYILTNAHIIDGVHRIFVKLWDQTTYRATLVGMDPLTDLAVLYIDAQGLVPAEFGSYFYIREADFAAIQENDGQLKNGSIAYLSRKVSTGTISLELIEVTIGSSQGPVYNRFGQVVAMSGGQICELFDLYLESDKGYALPSILVSKVVQQLMEKGYVSGRPTLGITTEAITKVYQQFWDIPGGLRILSLDEKVQQAGLREGDILLSLEGERMTENVDLYELLYSSPVGKTLKAVVYRDGNTMEFRLTIGEQ